MSYRRPCACPHKFPLCGCGEGLAGKALLRRSRTLSSLAGWPAPGLDPAEVARVLAKYGKPAAGISPGQGDCGCSGA